jgi:D-alanyl-D-alanine dipeptidase
MKTIAAFATLVLSLTTANAQIKTPQPPQIKVPFTASLQAVVVTTKNWNNTAGTAWLYDRKTANSDWKAVGAAFPVNVGRSGLAWGNETPRETAATKNKQEGDGNSPAGLFPLTMTFGTASKPEAVEMPYTKLDQYTECVDDVRSQFYNRVVNRMQVGNFDWKSSEKMLSKMPEYELGVFVAYNSYPAVRSGGSCVFLHVWEQGPGATDGGTAMDRRDLERIVAWLQPAKNPYLVQLTEDDYDRFQKTWKLPKLK